MIWPLRLSVKPLYVPVLLMMMGTVTLPPDIPPIWKVRSAIVDGRDLMDLDVTGPNVQLRNVVLDDLAERRPIAAVATERLHQHRNPRLVLDN